MEAVVQALDAGQNALLESPTGTGKTLCLLCATLGWRRHYEKRVAAARTSWEAQATDPSTPGAAGQSCPHVWYASRTHSQLKQVMSELKRTSYRPFSVVLGSREHFCIHASVSKHTGARQNAMCKKARDEDRCPFWMSLRKGLGKQVNISCCDIEEIVSACQTGRICPFYKTREESKEAELLLVPYDYLINPQTRESLQINLKGNVLIFDEGHNIEKSCEQIASFELTCSDLAGAMSEIDDAFAVLETDATRCGDALKDMTMEVLMGLLNDLKRNFMALEDSIMEEKLLHDSVSGRHLFKGAGSCIFEIFARGNTKGDGIRRKDAQRICNVIRRAISVLTYSMESTNTGGLYLDKMQALLVTMFKSEPQELDTNYQTLIYENEDESKKRGAKRKAVDFFSDIGKQRFAARGEVPRTLCLWCFSSSVAMRELERHEIRSCIITSGTLAPIEGTVESFGVPFPVILSNPHVIDTTRQLWGCVLCRGPDNHPLDGSFEQRNALGYLKDVGQTVVHFAKIVPDGILVAFHSYSQKEAALLSWQKSGIWDAISSEKPMFDEPKTNWEMRVTMEKYSEAIEGSVRLGGDGAKRGAVLTAVCRGKLCEGVDFTDRQCRLVIVVGVPYPSRNDLRVVLKQNFLDTRVKDGEGRRWYCREAVRAVNQTVGRVIRHKNDFGGVVLCDGRYGRSGQLSLLASGLSSWIKPRLSVQESFAPAVEGCRTFFGISRPVPVSRPPPPVVSAPEKEDPQEPATQASGETQGGGVAASQGCGRLGGDGGGSGGGGVPLSALGALWKRRGRIAAVAPTSSLTPNGSAVVPSVAPPTVARVQASTSAPTARVASASPGTVPSSNGARESSGSTPRLCGSLGGRDIAQPWLERAGRLLPRMEYERVQAEVAVMRSQAELVCNGGAAAADADRRLSESMRTIAEILLPEFNFDTAEEEGVRQGLVKECGTLIPKLLRPLWRGRVDAVLRKQGQETASFWQSHKVG
eukprot:TRINITY_DN32748_c0_g4_i1.p1 TRINITY_DN32748_c0_g4~~TRINITY_DN32748_c0_g4_i1.p1  ORF type:complete len:1032 (+),score=137.48 TRINITY_DN32748_c0_g4_i1:146-3097(+)